MSGGCSHARGVNRWCFFRNYRQRCPTPVKLTPGKFGRFGRFGKFGKFDPSLQGLGTCASDSRTVHSSQIGSIFDRVVQMTPFPP